MRRDRNTVSIKTAHSRIRACIGVQGGMGRLLIAKLLMAESHVHWFVSSHGGAKHRKTVMRFIRASNWRLIVERVTVLKLSHARA